MDATVGESTDDQVLRVLLAEVADLTKAMRELLMTADRFINFSGLIAVGALTLGVIKHDEGKNWLAIVFAPYGLAITFGYLIQLYTEVEKRAGYKKFLEARVNDLMRSPVLLESQVNTRVERNRKSVIGMQAMNGLAYLVFVGASTFETYDRYSGKGPEVLGWHLFNLSTLNIAVLVLATFVLAGALWENSRASDRAYSHAVSVQASYMPPAP
ncbi:hypothetical protein [Actinomadura sp. WMMA1423]|uniref:hypothetical protein n=1 Tax=Actinomadura sp. WMMA1423 TaxID=2591108 RepID=UPI001146CBAD|nr:hypothetical protein [Actinomadura sp. WMMA1423]